jgi:hypothetical protein
MLAQWCAIGAWLSAFTEMAMLERLDRHFSPVAGKALERFGFAYAEMITNWPAIVGDSMAAVSTPERVRWPRGGEAHEGPGRGGTLVIAAEAGHAIELQHDTERIIERINGYYGYEAITALKIRQAGEKRRPAPKPRPAEMSPADTKRLHNDLEAIADEPLKAALERLGRGVLGGDRP